MQDFQQPSNIYIYKDKQQSLMLLIQCHSTVCVQRSIDVCSTKHHSTWRTAASTPQTLLVTSICQVAGNTTPQYMTDCCIHTSDIARRQHLWSTGCHQLFVPRHRRSMLGRRTYSVAGRAACNSLPDYLRDPSGFFDSFRRDLKLVLLEYKAH